MLRGCQKKIVFLKNTGSKIFDEAYFVISGKDDAPHVSEEMMVDEAKRIINESTINRERCGISSRIRLLSLALSFTLGAVLSGVIVSLIFIIAG